MTDGFANAPDDADDPHVTGDAVVQLRGFTLPVDARFADRVGRRIERRALSNEFLEFAWAVPVAVLLELVRIPGEVFRARKRATTDDSER